jgi:hypothetical protein
MACHDWQLVTVCVTASCMIEAQICQKQADWLVIMDTAFTLLCILTSFLSRQIRLSMRTPLLAPEKKSYKMTCPPPPHHTTQLTGPTGIRKEHSCIVQANSSLLASPRLKSPLRKVIKEFIILFCGLSSFNPRGEYLYLIFCWGYEVRISVLYSRTASVLASISCSIRIQ